MVTPEVVGSHRTRCVVHRGHSSCGSATGASSFLIGLVADLTADPTRRAIQDRLRTGEATLAELAEPFDMSVQAVALHLKVLERSGLITRGRVAQTRPARIAPAPLDNATQWLLRYR